MRSFRHHERRRDFRSLQYRHRNKRPASKSNPVENQAKLEQKYGLPPGTYKLMWKAQSGLCAICDDILTRPHVDHDHATGKVRGLLCHRCNPGIGLLKESIDTLQQAQKYLKQSLDKNPNLR